MNFSAVTKIANFLVRNHTTIEKAGLLGAEIIIGSVLASKYDVPLNIGSDVISINNSSDDSDFDIDDLGIYFRPKNLTTAAIQSTTQHAKTLYFDSRRIEAAKDIYMLASKPGIDDETKEYAIICLNKIREMMDYDSRKREVQKMILNLINA